MTRRPKRERLETDQRIDGWVSQETYEALEEAVYQQKTSKAILIEKALRAFLGLDPLPEKSAQPDQGSKGGVVYGLPARHNLSLADGS